MGELRSKTTREILFRGKDKETGVWREGFYIHLHKTTYCFKEDYDKNPDNDIHQIVFEQMTDWCLPNKHYRTDVVPETVCRYAGRTDKNGVNVFENDIVKVNYIEKRCNSKGEHYESGYSMIEQVIYSNEHGGFMLKTGYDGIDFYRHLEKQEFQNTRIDSIEVLGNIFDNPELIKEIYE